MKRILIYLGALITISGIAWAVETHNLDMNFHKIIHVGTATVSGDAIAIGLAAGGDLGGTYSSPTVTAIHETSGPTKLTFGTIADTQLLTRSGTTIIGTAASSGGASNPVYAACLTDAVAKTGLTNANMLCIFDDFESRTAWSSTVDLSLQNGWVSVTGTTAFQTQPQFFVPTTSSSKWYIAWYGSVVSTGGGAQAQIGIIDAGIFFQASVGYLDAVSSTKFCGVFSGGTTVTLISTTNKDTSNHLFKEWTNATTITMTVDNAGTATDTMGAGSVIMKPWINGTASGVKVDWLCICGQTATRVLP